MSKLIHVPTLSKIDEHDDNSASFSIDPLHSGYGMTLGNSLRRVLLSSIRGAAVVSFKVDGASHEFTTIDGVKEDVVDIMLNLKSLQFKVHTDEPVTLRLEKKGSGEVTGKDIKLTADVELANPKQVICTITKASANVAMDLVVEPGRGYRPLDEKRDDSRTSGMIALDAAFSPVERVRYKVQNTRVGQMTNLDKLVVTIDTDGTITPKDAFEEANAILVNQYQALAGSTTVEAGEPLTELVEEAEKGSNDLEMSIDDLSLSARTTNALHNNNIKTVQDLVVLSDSELRTLKGFGAKALEEVQEKIKEIDLG